VGAWGGGGGRELHKLTNKGEKCQGNFFLFFCGGGGEETQHEPMLFFNMNEGRNVDQNGS